MGFAWRGARRRRLAQLGCGRNLKGLAQPADRTRQYLLTSSEEWTRTCPHLSVVQAEEGAWGIAVDRTDEVRTDEVSNRRGFRTSSNRRGFQNGERHGGWTRRRWGTCSSRMGWARPGVVVEEAFEGGVDQGRREGGGLLRRVRFGVMGERRLEGKALGTRPEEHREWVEGLVGGALRARGPVRAMATAELGRLGANAPGFPVGDSDDDSDDDSETGPDSSEGKGRGAGSVIHRQGRAQAARRRGIGPRWPARRRTPTCRGDTSKLHRALPALWRLGSVGQSLRILAAANSAKRLRPCAAALERLHPCVRACVRARARACVRACVHRWMKACRQACVGCALARHPHWQARRPSTRRTRHKAKLRAR